MRSGLFLAAVMLACGPADGSVVDSRYCTGGGVGGAYTFIYQWTLHGDGSVWTNCLVVNNSIGSAYSSDFYWKLGSDANKFRQCIVFHDVDTPNRGTWLFSLEPTERVNYGDVGSMLNGYIYVFDASECV